MSEREIWWLADLYSLTENCYDNLETDTLLLSLLAQSYKDSNKSISVKTYWDFWSVWLNNLFR